MASEQYQKWSLIAILIIIGGIVLFSLTRPSYKSAELPAGDLKQTAVPGPLIDLESEKNRLSDQLDAFSNNPDALAHLGDEYFEKKRYFLAIQVYEKALELNPEDVDTFNDLGLSLFFTGKPDEAVETLKKGREVDPSFQRIWLSLGYVLLSTGKKEEAREILEKTAQMDPDTEMGREATKFLGLIE